MLPYFVYFLMAAAGSIFHSGFSTGLDARSLSRWSLVTAFYTFAAISFFIHYRGANSYDVILWNVDPSNVDQHPGRIWDLGDIQFLRGIGD